jgi:hypothetical protein
MSKFTDQLDKDLDAVFYNADEFARSVTYMPASGGAKAIDAIVTYGEGDQYKGADSYGVRATLRVKASDIVQPARSDEVTIGTDRWIVIGADPNDDGREWIVQANKVTV